MIRCGISTPQVHTLTGSGFVASALVLVTMPDATSPIPVRPISVTSTVITFSFIFATCGTYSFVVTDATGDCDENASAPFSLTLVADKCPSNDVLLTLGDLRQMTQIRLGDRDGAIWSNDEVVQNLIEAYDRIATQLAVFWDQVYSENLPRGFSVTQPWELNFLPDSGGFNYGVANFTAEFERVAGESVGMDLKRRIGPANHTSPFEATDGLLTRAGASTAIPAVVDLPKTVTKLDRVTWDNRSCDAVEPRGFSRLDSRYEITAGEVFAFCFQKDGPRALRKIRVPATQCDTLTVNGSWGTVRNVGDITTESVTGTWGIARRIPSYHPMSDLFGAPRRFFQEGKNVRVEHFRLGRDLSGDEVFCELPPRYARYCVDFAISACLSRPGPGYDAELAKHFDERWKRGVARIQRRIFLVDQEHIFVMGGAGTRADHRPPRARLPWNYGSSVR